MFPSIEAALTEIVFLLSDREREVGGVRNIIAYGQLQDPALDRMAKAISSTGIEAKPKRDAELLDAASWVPELKTKALVIAYAEDDRFTGRVHDTKATRAAVFADGMRVPVIAISFGSQDWRTTLPRPFEIRVYPLAATDPESTAAIAILGERLRLDPRMAPLSMDPARLSTIESDLRSMAETICVTVENAASENEKRRIEIESFEASVPATFQVWWPKGSARMLDRAIITSKDFDGSLVVEKLRAELSTSLKTNAEKSWLANGLFSLSGCATNDERRQEWMRSRGDNAWLIRGAIHISRELLQAVPTAVWMRALST